MHGRLTENQRVDDELQRGEGFANEGHIAPIHGDGYVSERAAEGEEEEQSEKSEA